MDHVRKRKDRVQFRPLELWKPFFWDDWLPTGIFLRSKRRPVLLPSGHEVDEEIYFAVRLMPDMERTVLSFDLYAFLKDPGTHTKRSVRREGYWYYHLGKTTSPSASIDVLEYLMHSLEMLALGKSVILDYPHDVLNHLVAWEQRMGLEDRTVETGIKEFRTKPATQPH